MEIFAIFPPFRWQRIRGKKKKKQKLYAITSRHSSNKNEQIKSKTEIEENEKKCSHGTTVCKW